MPKIIQTITGWYYPCSKKIFEWDKTGKFLDVCLDTSVYKTKKDLEEAYENKCFCGKGCKPQKIRIVVEKILNVIEKF